MLLFPPTCWHGADTILFSSVVCITSRSVMLKHSKQQVKPPFCQHVFIYYFSLVPLLTILRRVTQSLHQFQQRPLKKEKKEKMLTCRDSALSQIYFQFVKHRLCQKQWQPQIITAVNVATNQNDQYSEFQMTPPPSPAPSSVITGLRSAWPARLPQPCRRHISIFNTIFFHLIKQILWTDITL